MSSVGLSADLELDIARALSSVNEVEAAIAAATTGVPVDLDLSGVSAFADAIAAAVADVSATPVVVDADTTAIPVAIVDAVDTTLTTPVPVEADTAAIPPEIEAAVASVTPEPIVVEADTEQAQTAVQDLGTTASTTAAATGDLGGSLTALGAAGGIAEGSVTELLATLKETDGVIGEVATGFGILGVATAGFFAEGLQAVSAGQRFDLVLGDMGNKIRDINLNGLSTDVNTLGIKFGSTSADMENTNSRLFQFAINAGASKDAAVTFAQQVETLAARAISLNPQLGTLSDVADVLGPKLARGGRFASEFGLALTPAEINARALSDTGKTLVAELTVQEKAMAGAEIASARYGSTLATTVAEGEKNAAVQAESLKATFKEAVEQIGVPLVAPVLDLIRAAEPDAVLIAQTLGSLAGDVLPVVSAALTAVSIPLQVIGAIVGAIPGPVISATVAFFGMSAALDAVAGALLADAAGAIALDAAFVPLAAIAATVILVNGLLSATPPLADDVTRAIDTAAKGFDAFDTSVHDVIKSEIEAADKIGDFAKRMNDANVSSENLNASILAGGNQFEIYKNKILEAAIAQGASADTIGRLWGEFDHLKDSTEASAKVALESAVNTGKLTQQERDAAVSAAGLIDGKVNYAAALDRVQPKIKAATDSADAAAKADQAQADATAAVEKAMADLGSTAPAVASSLDAVRTSTSTTDTSMISLAENIKAANLSAAQMQAIADSLGISVDQLKTFVDSATKELDAFVSTALKGLPTVSSAIDDVLNPKKKPDKAIIIDPKQLQDEIAQDILKITVFNNQLAALHAQGLDNLAKVAAEKGPEFTAALTKSIETGGLDLAASLDRQFGDLNQLTRDEPAKLREAGAGIITATGDVMAAATAAAGDNFRPGAGIPAAMNAAKEAIATASGAVIGAATDVGTKSGEGMTGGVQSAANQTMPPAMKSAADVTIEAGNLVIAAAELVGSGAGASMGLGLEVGSSGAGGIPTATGHVNDLIDQAANSTRDVASNLGIGVGFAFSAGIAAGIGAGVDAAIAAAVAVVDQTHAAAATRARVQSPSLLFAELGRHLTEGIAVGMLSDASASVAAESVVAAAVAGAAAAIPTAQVAPIQSAAPGVTVAPPSRAGGGSGGTGRDAPLFLIEHAEFGSTGAAADVEWLAKTKLVGL